MLKSKVFKLSDKSFLVNRISAIEDKQCYIKLWKLLVKENVKYMRNHNGLFFNVGNDRKLVNLNHDLIDYSNLDDYTKWCYEID